MPLDVVKTAPFRRARSQRAAPAPLDTTSVLTKIAGVHQACFGGNIRAVEWFLMNSPESTLIKNMMGHTPADLAKLGGHREVLDIDLANPRFSSRKTANGDKRAT
jgi:hypothetical protein